MQIIIEGHQVDLQLPRENVLLREVIREVEDFLFSLGKLPNALRLDGEDLSQEELDRLLDRPLCGEETLEFGVETVIDFVVSNLKGAKVANQELCKLIQGFADGIHDPNVVEIGGRLGEELSHFFDFWLRLSQLIPEQFSSLTIGEEGLSISDCLDSLRSHLEQSLGAMEDNDFVLAADLLQYEVLPLIEGVDEVIPSLTDRISALETEEQSVEPSAAT